MRHLLALLALTPCFAAMGQTPAPASAAAGLTATAPPNLPLAVAAAVEIADLAAQQRGGRTQLAVLGTTHLRQAPPALARPAFFAPLIERLAAFKPDLVAVESIGGAQCDQLRAYEFAYESTAETYCFDASLARAQLKLDGAAAEREIEDLLAAVPALAPTQRRRLVALFLAAGEPDSACVQWLRLAPAEQHADAALTPELLAQIEQRLMRQEENTLIAVPLAVQLGLDRIFPVDDHTGDLATGPTDSDVWRTDMTRIWNNAAAQTQQKLTQQAKERALADSDVLAWYGWTNSAAAAQRTVAGDFAAAAGDTGPQRTGRAYLAYWETRNLRMVANIREVVGRTRASRAVAIVGAAHKPYYERYLGMTSDIELVGLDSLLKP